MNKGTILTRLERLERAATLSGRPHVLWGMTEAEFERGKAELLGSSHWSEGDTLIHLSWMMTDKTANRRAQA